MEPHLFLVFDDDSEASSPFVTGAGYDGRLADRDVEASSEDPVDVCQRVRNVVRLALSRPASQVEIEALVVLSRRDA